MVHPADADLTAMDAIAVQQVDVTYTGEAAHAAAFPDKGRNALDAAVLGYVNVAALRQHIEPGERIHGIFTDGGDKPNIVPGHAPARVDRALAHGRRPRGAQGAVPGLPARPGRCAAGCDDGASSGTTPTYADMVDNAAIGERYAANAARARPHRPRAVAERPGRGQHRHGQRELRRAVDPPDDPGGARRACRSTRPAFASYAGGPEGDAAVIDGAKALALTVADLWLDGGLVDLARSEWEAAVAGRRARRPRGEGGAPVSADARTPDVRSAPYDGVRGRRVHACRGRRPPAVLHQPRRAGVRPRQPARGGEGRPVRPLLPLAQEPAPAVPRRVRRRPRHRRRRQRSTPPIGLQRAEELYDRVFFEYGDDSVAQLGGVHLACEQASNLLTKVLEWGRLMSYLEQSTRYIAYDARLGGRYRYYRDPEVLGSPLGLRYVGDLDRLFDTYAEHGRRSCSTTSGSATPRSRATATSSTARRSGPRRSTPCAGSLPAASLSNVGIYGTGPGATRRCCCACGPTRCPRPAATPT